MKANKGQKSPKLQISFVNITIQCKIINNCQYDTKEMCFLKIWNFHFHYINFLKLHIVEYVKFSKHFQWNNGTGHCPTQLIKVAHNGHTYGFKLNCIYLNIFWTSIFNDTYIITLLIFTLLPLHAHWISTITYTKQVHLA